MIMHRQHSNSHFAASTEGRRSEATVGEGHQVARRAKIAFFARLRPVPSRRSSHNENRRRQHLRLPGRLPALFTVVLTLAAIGGCAHTSWGDGGTEAQRYYYFIKSNYLEIDHDDQAALDNMAMASRASSGSYYLKLETARLHSRNGDVEGALKYAREAIVLNPKSPSPRLFAAWVAAADGRWEEAEQYYQDVLRQDPKNAEALTHLGALYGETGRLKEAEATFKRLVAADAGSLSYYYLGRFYTNTGRTQEAIKAYALSVKKNTEQKNPEYVAALTELAVLYEQVNNNPAAERTYRSLIKARPDSSMPKARLARLLLKTGRKKEAEKIVREMGGQDLEGNDQVQLQIGLIYLDQGLYQEAAAEFRQVLKSDPASDQARYLLASALLESDQVAEAREHLKKIPAASDLYVDARLLLASTTQGDETRARLTEALSIITEGIAARPEASSRLQMAEAMITEEMGDLSQARKLLLAAVKDFPKEAEIRFRLGVVEDKLGNKSACIAAMRKTIELEPKHADALNYLAYTWAERRENLQEALVMAEKADRLKPDNGYIIDTLAWIHFQLGDAPQALALLKRAAALSGQDPVVLDHLGDVLVQLDRRQEARDAYRQALERGFTNPEALHEKINRLAD